VVIGGSRGIGLAVAELLSAQGAGVVINGRDADAVSAAIQRVSNAVAHLGSPADHATADALIDMCVGEFGAIDVLVNCAGTPEPPGSSILNVTSEQFRQLLDAHLGTVFETCRAAAPGWRRDREYQFVRISRRLREPDIRPGRARSTASPWRSPRS
jgi:NAD(P)-dependent dehydrogenase (short-subunit alcohol dehydrogenase family)